MITEAETSSGDPGEGPPGVGRRSLFRPPALFTHRGISRKEILTSTEEKERKHMAKIENMMAYKMNREGITNTDQLAEAIAMVSVFGTLEVITQEINAVINFMGHTEEFQTDKDIKHHARQAAALIGNDRLYMLRELLRIHTCNMESMQKLVNSVVKEPNEEKRKEIFERCERLPAEYFETGWHPIISDFLSAEFDSAVRMASGGSQQKEHETNTESKDEAVVAGEMDTFLAQLAEIDLCAASEAELQRIQSRATELLHEKMTAIPEDYTAENYC